MHIFGSALDAELQNVEGKKKSERKAKMRQIIQRWIPEANETKGQTRKFRDPAARGSHADEGPTTI